LKISKLQIQTHSIFLMTRKNSLMKAKMKIIFRMNMRQFMELIMNFRNLSKKKFKNQNEIKEEDF
jgi:hypothetical protein